MSSAWGPACAARAGRRSAGAGAATCRHPAASTTSAWPRGRRSVGARYVRPVSSAQTAERAAPRERPRAVADAAAGTASVSGTRACRRASRCAARGRCALPPQLAVAGRAAMQELPALTATRVVQSVQWRVVPTVAVLDSTALRAPPAAPLDSRALCIGAPETITTIGEATASGTALGGGGSRDTILAALSS